METLADQLHKGVFLPELPIKWLDIVPSTLHLRPGREVVWILRVWIVVGKKGAWEHLEKEKMVTVGFGT